MSAQEVQEVLKDNNIKDEIYEINDDRYSLCYTELIPDLINCIKYQQEQIEQLQNQIKEMKGE